jgi:hypothetical protein
MTILAIAVPNCGILEQCLLLVRLQLPYSVLQTFLALLQHFCKSKTSMRPTAQALDLVFLIFFKYSDKDAHKEYPYKSVANIINSTKSYLILSITKKVLDWGIKCRIPKKVNFILSFHKIITLWLGILYLISLCNCPALAQLMLTSDAISLVSIPWLSFTH